MQDEIVSRLANQLGTQLIAVEARRVEHSSHPDSMDMYFLGLFWYYKGPDPKNLLRARECFERSVSLDPANIDALAGIASVDIASGAGLLSADRAARLAAAEAVATKVLSPAPDHAAAHLQLGAIQNFTNRAAQGIAECERALALDRNNANAHGQIGFAKIALVGTRRPQNIYKMHFASRRVTHSPISGRLLLVRPNCISAGMRKQLSGCAEASNSTEIIPPHSSISRRRLRGAAT
jgi:tetratricopeptide (TPR) repeat protein